MPNGIIRGRERVRKKRKKEEMFDEKEKRSEAN